MPPLADRTDSLETATSDAAASMETMESEAAEFFAARSAEQAKAPLTSVAAAVEKAEATPPASTKSATAPVTKGKVGGPPSLTTPAKPADATAAKADAATTAKADAKTTEALGDADKQFADIDAPFKQGTSKAGWERLRSAIGHYKGIANTSAQELEAARAELTALKESSAKSEPSAETKAVFEAITKERDSLRSQLQAVAGERIFDAESKPRRDAAISMAKQAVGTEQAARIEQLLAMGESTYRDNAIEEMLATLPPLRATKLTQAVANLDQLSAERASAAAQGGEMWQKRVADFNASQSRANEERIAKASATFDSELKEWQSAGLTPDEIASARSVYTGKDATLQDASRAALWGAIGPRVANVLQATQARVAELEGELAKLRGAQPGVGAAASGTLPVAAAGEDDDPSITSYAERIAREAARAGLRWS